MTSTAGLYTPAPTDTPVPTDAPVPVDTPAASSAQKTPFSSSDAFQADCGSFGCQTAERRQTCCTEMLHREEQAPFASHLAAGEWSGGLW